MAGFWFALSLAPIALIPLSLVICHFTCRPCRERGEQMKVAMQMRVANDLAAMKRATQVGTDRVLVFLARKQGR